MAETRTKNSIRNISFGFINRIVVLILPFITRTIILYQLGEEYLGIGTLFSSILSFLSLTELGLGTAIVYMMYKYIALNDNEGISALLKYFRKIYRVIGTAILVLGLLLIPAVPYLIKGETPAGINVYLLYSFYLINSAISYFFAGYRQCLLIAHQRMDITRKIATLIQIFVQFGQVLIICLTKNFYLYAVAPIIGTIITNFLNYKVTKRMYPDIKCEGNITQEEKRELFKKIGGLFGTKLNSIIVHSADMVVISAFLGLNVTAQYGNYYYVMNAVCGLVSIFFSSITASIGNKIVTDSIESTYALFKKINFMNSWLVGWFSVCFLCLYEPFMCIWVGQDNTLGIAFVFLFVLYFFIYEIQRAILTFKDAAGLWYEDRYRPYVSMVINLASNLILIKFIGIYGIVLSTVLTFMISLPWVNSLLFKKLFKKPAWNNLLNVLRLFVITVIAGGVTYFLCMQLGNSIVAFVGKVALCCVVPNIIFIIFYFRTKEFKSITTPMIRVAKNKFKKILKRG